MQAKKCSICDQEFSGKPIGFSFLSLLFCPHCLCAQNLTPKSLESSPFMGGQTRTMRGFYRDLSKKLEKRFRLREKDVIVDIGATDGTFLRTFDVSGLKRVAFECAHEFQDDAKTGIEYFIAKPWSSCVLNKVVGTKAKLITNFNSILTWKKPASFLKEVETSLRDDGILILELPLLSDIIESFDIGTLLEQNHSYYCFKFLFKLLDESELYIFDYEKILTGGQRHRFYCRKKGSYVETEKSDLSFDGILKKEKELLTNENLSSFFEKVQEQKKVLDGFFKDMQRNSQRVYLYGVDSKSEGLMQFLEIDSAKIQGIYDFSGTISRGVRDFLGINILNEEDLLEQRPDFFLVLPYFFINEIYQKELAFRKSGVKFVLPFPQFRIVN